MKKKLLSGLLTLSVTLVSVLSPVAALADRIDDKPYLSLGADLTEEQKSTVLDLLGVDPAELGNYTVSEVTNVEEHQYLGSYLDASVIGSKALSSVKVVGREDGYGIQVTTTNISYCTEGMYENALATAGLENAEVVVVGPFPISGTAALVGAMEAYGSMTGDIIEPELMDGATNELVVTSQLAERIGAEKAVNLIGALKDVIAANEYDSEEEISQAIDAVANELEISLSDADRQLILDLMKKLADLDLDIDKIKEQAGEIYDRISNLDLSEYGITQESVDGFLGQLGEFFADLFDAIVRFFQNLF